MKDDQKRDQSPAQKDRDETPAIYSLRRADGRPALSRRTFLEVAAAAAASAALSSGCATPGRGGRRGPAIAHKEAITALAVNAAGKLLASGDKGGTIKLWQLPEGALLHSWSGHKSPISNLSFPHMDDALWSLDSSGSLERWHLPDGKVISNGNFIGGSQNNGHVFAVPSAGDWYAVRAIGGGVELRNQMTGERLRSLEGLDDNVNALAATADGRLLLAGGAQGNVSLWTEPDNTHVQTLKTNFKAVSALTIAPNGTLGLSAHADEGLRTWHLPELRAGTTYESPLGKPFSVAIRPQLDLFVAGSEKPQIGMWKLAPGASKPRLLKGHAAAVRATVITPDGSLLISGSDDKTIRLWSLPDGKYLRNLLDLAINYKYVEGTGYKAMDVYGRTVTFTLPCGSPIPPGAVCTCNCVPGAITIPRGHIQRYNTFGYCTCDLICTCNTVCTCQSVSRGGGGYTYYISYWYPN
jgi:WD40 repeat protein